MRNWIKTVGMSATAITFACFSVGCEHDDLVSGSSDTAQADGGDGYYCNDFGCGNSNPDCGYVYIPDSGYVFTGDNC